MSCCRFADFNFAVILALSFQLTVHVTDSQFCTMLVISLLYVSIQILQKSGHFCFAPWPKRPKDHSGCVCHDDIAVLLKCNYPCRHGILWSHAESIVIMIQPLIQVHTPLHMTILRDHVILVIGLLCRYNNHIILLLGREIDASQKLGLADKTCCIYGIFNMPAFLSIL